MSKKCPYCDSKNIGKYKGSSGKMMAYCIDCAEIYDHAVTVPEELWDKRPEEDRLNKIIKELREQLNEYIKLPTDEEEDDFIVEEDKPDK